MKSILLAVALLFAFVAPAPAGSRVRRGDDGILRLVPCKTACKCKPGKCRCCKGCACKGCKKVKKKADLRRFYIRYRGGPTRACPNCR